MLETSFAIFVDSMTAFSEERTPSCPIGRRDLSAVVETQDSYEDVGSVQTVRKNLKTSVNLFIACLVQIDSFDEENCIHDRSFYYK